MGVWRDVQYIIVVTILGTGAFPFHQPKAEQDVRTLDKRPLPCRLHVSFIHCKVNDSHSLFEYVTLLGTVFKLRGFELIEAR